MSLTASDPPGELHSLAPSCGDKVTHLESFSLSCFFHILVSCILASWIQSGVVMLMLTANMPCPLSALQTCCSWWPSPPPSAWCQRPSRWWRGGEGLRRLRPPTSSMRYDGHSCWLLPLLCQLQEDRDSGPHRRRRWLRLQRLAGYFLLAPWEGGETLVWEWRRRRREASRPSRLGLNWEDRSALWLVQDPQQPHPFLQWPRPSLLLVL